MRLSQRLRSKAGFARALKSGRSFSSPGLALKFLANQLSFNRYGVLAGRRSFRLAVQRNRVKRKLRQVWQELAEGIRLGFDLILIARSSSLEKSLSDLRPEARNLLKSARLLKD